MGDLKPRFSAVHEGRLAGSGPTSDQPRTKQHGNIIDRDRSKDDFLCSVTNSHDTSRFKIDITRKLLLYHTLLCKGKAFVNSNLEALLSLF